MHFNRLAGEQRGVRFRHISRDVVVARQVKIIEECQHSILLFQGVLFLYDETLAGQRRDVYILAKILKQVFGADVTSYLIKYAVEETLRYVRPEDIKLGTALKMVLEHQYLRGKFINVAEYFKDLGVTKIEILEDELHFHNFEEDRISK